MCKVLAFALFLLLSQGFSWRYACLSEPYEVVLVSDVTSLSSNVQNVTYILDDFFNWQFPNFLGPAVYNMAYDINQIHLLFHQLRDYDIPSIISSITNDTFSDLQWRQGLGWKAGLEYLASMLTNFFLSNCLRVYVEGGSINAHIDNWPYSEFSDTNEYSEIDAITKQISQSGRDSTIQGYNNIQNNIYDEEPQGMIPYRGNIKTWGYWTRQQGEDFNNLKDSFSGWSLSSTPDLYLGTVHIYGRSITVQLSWTPISFYIPFIRGLLLFLSVLSAGVLILKYSSGVITN